jgi:hypothetical protein
MAEILAIKDVNQYKNIDLELVIQEVENLTNKNIKLIKDN